MFRHIRARLPAHGTNGRVASTGLIFVEGLRICLLGHGTLSVTEVAVSVAVTLIVLITGIAAFQKVERTVIDSV